MPAVAAFPSLPTTMTAIKIAAPGGPEALVATRLPVPQPQRGEILVRVAAAGVNYPDVMQRKGGYPPPPGAPDTPGLEIAGTVAATGPDTGEWKVGDAVCALVAGGGYAEYCTVPAPQALPVPRGLDMIAAAAIPETFFTVWVNLFDRGRLAAGETVLVHGGSGGIGSAAIQVAHAFGARVFTTARTAEKCKACEAIGAERAINYREEDFVAVVQTLTGGRGVDLIIDIVGGDYLARNFKALAVEGRLVQVAVRAGAKVEVPLYVLMQKRLTLTGSTLRPRPVAEKGRIAAALRQHVWPLFEAGKVRSLIYKTFPLEMAAEAHALMESSDHIGKIVLTL
jgi:putative PIG3 family NAD(P)H quinone oxidoreductase